MVAAKKKSFIRHFREVFFSDQNIKTRRWVVFLFLLVRTAANNTDTHTYTDTHSHAYTHVHNELSRYFSNGLLYLGLPV